MLILRFLGGTRVEVIGHWLGFWQGVAWDQGGTKSFDGFHAHHVQQAADTIPDGLIDHIQEQVDRISAQPAPVIDSGFRAGCRALSYYVGRN